MKLLLLLLLLTAACGAGLVDHTGIDLQTVGPPLQCSLPQKDCGGSVCVSVDKDPSNCGACGNVCATPQNATNKCEASHCGFTCNPGFFFCGGGQRCCPAGALAAGGDTSCAVVEGAVQCWGANDSWQLGTDPAAAGWSARPVAVPGVAGAGSVAVGLKHVCAILAGTGEVMCWGANGSQQLGVVGGNGPPVKVPGVSGAQSLALGDRHSCAATSNSVLCWGANDSGQLGQGSVTATGVPAAIPSFAATSIAAGTAFTCAVSGGDVYCWGINSKLQLGDSAPAPSPSPHLVNGVSVPATSVAAGDAHACAIGSASKPYCWGAGDSGQIGDGKLDPTSPATGVSNISSASLVAAGAIHTCAVSGGSAFCWGGNNFGQLGMSPRDASRPSQVGTLSAVQRIALGANHSCAQNGDGAVYCWGNNVSGQAGALAGGTVLGPRPID
jgi:alpha-tubulin suppressor-like RCC1 family protein